MIVLAIDPSITCTGWALLGYESERPFAWGTARAPEGGPVARARELFDDLIFGVRANLPTTNISHIVIETPQTATWGGRKQRSANHLPTYGIAVGFIAASLRAAMPDAEMHEVSATEWGKSFRTGGEDKAARLVAVSRLFGIEAKALGNKGQAPNVADAMLLGAWWIRRDKLKAKGGAA